MTPCPVIIDCDPGIDDAIALLAAFQAPELSIEAITVVSGNRPLEITARNALQITELAKRRIPVYAGCWQPLVRDALRGRFHGEQGLGGCRLPVPRVTVAAQHAVDFLIQRLRVAGEQQRPVTLCCLGPLTNIATALRLAPDIVSGIHRLVLMGGAYRDNGNTSLYAEFNMLADPHAADIVFRQEIPLTVLPLDVTHQVILTPLLVDELTLVAGTIAPQLKELMASWDRNDPQRYGSRGGPLHDPLVIAWLLRPEYFSSEKARVFIELDSLESLGRTTADWYGKSQQPQNVDVVTGVEPAKVFTLFCQLFSRYQEAEL